MEVKIQMRTNEKIFQIVGIEELNDIIDYYGANEITFNEVNGTLTIYGLDNYLRDIFIEQDERIKRIKKLLEEIKKEYDVDIDDIWNTVIE